MSVTVLYSLAGVCVAFALATAILRNLHREHARFVTKLIASLLFCVTAFWAATKRGAPMNTQTVLMLAALVLGFLGDILLGIDPFVPKSHKDFVFILGGVPFFFGHVLYIILLLSYGKMHWPLLLLLPVVPMIFWTLEKLRLIELGKNLLPLMVYGLVLGGMMLSTLNLALQGGGLGRMMWFPGILFAVSDTSLFCHSFGKEKLRRVLPVLSFTIMLPYYGAQALFAISVMYL